MSARHPIQPVEEDKSGVYRFKRNAIVEYLLEAGQFDMNHLAMQDFTREDREQFAQLIGYSVAGSSDLSYMSDEVIESAQESIVNGRDPNELRAEILSDKLKEVADKFRDVACMVFNIHPDDLIQDFD